MNSIKKLIAIVALISAGNMFAMKWEPGQGKPPWAGKAGEGRHGKKGKGKSTVEKLSESTSWEPGQGKPPWAGQAGEGRYGKNKN